MSIDLSKLEEQCSGDPVRIKLYLDTYQEAVEAQLPLLTEAIENENYTELRKVAHTLKPLFTILGFSQIWEIANDIESAFDLNQNLDSIKDRSNQLQGLLLSSLKSVKEKNQEL